MEKIEFYPSIFIAKETNSMGKQLVLTIDESGNKDENLLKAKEALEKDNDKLTKVLNALKSNPYTDPLKGSDTNRDDTFWGGRDVIDGMTHWVFDTEKQAAAIRIKEIIKRHGWKLHRFRYQDQSSATNSLIKELKEEKNQKDLATLGIMDWFNAMVQSQAEFEKIFNQKTSYDSQKESTVKREAQMPVTDRIEELVLYVNSVIIFNQDDKAWTELYKNINGIVKQATTSARARRSGNDNKSTEEDN